MSWEQKLPLAAMIQTEQPTPRMLSASLRTFLMDQELVRMRSRSGGMRCLAAIDEWLWSYLRADPAVLGPSEEWKRHQREREQFARDHAPHGSPSAEQVPQPPDTL